MNEWTRSNMKGLVTVALLVTALILPGSAWAHDESPATLEGYLHNLEDDGRITALQHETIERLYFELNRPHEAEHYIDAQLQAGKIDAETHNYLVTALLLVHTDRTIELVESNFAGNGNVVLLGTLNPQPPNPYISDQSGGELYNGIWGYVVGSREYALQTNSRGVHIIDVTNPANPFRVQFISMPGGRVWRDVDIHEDTSSGITYAYVGAQSSGNLWVINLQALSGTTAHGVDSNPIPSTDWVDRGRTNYGHTVTVKDGLLFTNSANQGSSLGCQIFDLLADPWNPPVIDGWDGSGNDCHDNIVRNIGGQDLLFSADGNSSDYRVVDISNVRSGGAPTLIGQAAGSGFYAHSAWLTDDSQFLFTFEESNVHDIAIWDVSDPTSPVFVRTFQWSGDAQDSARVHNCQIRGDFLLAGYYEAGFRVFDISNPPNPVEVGKYETWRDPNDDGNFEKSITGNFDGAWNLYSFLPSGNVLVSDMLTGTYIFRIDQVPLAAAPPDLAATAGNQQASLSWSASAGATGYSVHRATTSGGPYTTVATQLVNPSYTDTGLTNGTTYFYVVSATNASGDSGNSNEDSATPFNAPPCGDGVCEAGEDCTTCAADCPSFPLGSSCGNGICEAGDGEDCVTCAADCNGQQGGKPSGRFCCGFGGDSPVGCGDSACTTGGFSCTETPTGGGGSTCCGDLFCEGPEDGFNCSLDCGPAPECGDGTCDPGEDTCSCAADCGTPPATEVGFCTDGEDNDCDAAVDCADIDCDGVDPACQVVVCSSFGDKNSCNAQPTCSWSNKDKVCLAN